jgi:hypothetical protein
MSISQLTLIVRNPHAKIFVIHVLNTRYLMCPIVMYTMCSFKSKSDTIIFILCRVRAGLYIWFAIKFNRNESTRETERCFSRSENATYAVPKSKVPYVFYPMKV